MSPRAYDIDDPAAYTEAKRLLFRYYASHPSEIVPEEQAFLARGERAVVDVLGGEVTYWSWGRGATILLVHGVLGRGGQLIDFVEPLVRTGHRVVVFDAPGHGASKAPHTFPDLAARAIVELARVHGGFAGAVAHCGGASWMGYAFEHGLTVPRLALVSPGGGRAQIDAYIALKKLPPAVARELGRVLSAFEGREEWEIGCVPRNVRYWTAEGLVIHDRDDRYIPISYAREVVAAWQGARLVETEKLGHVGGLHSADVIAEVVRFLQ